MIDENFARLNRIYPNSKYVSIAAYNPEAFKDIPYDSSLDTKATQDKWKTKPLTYEQACIEANKGKRIGWIIPENFVVIDIDNKDNTLSQNKIETILKKFECNYNYNYTSKGIHILFRDSSGKIKTDARMKCGLNIEIDTRANESGYIVLPINDPHREWGEWHDHVEEIPYFLKPINKNNTPTFIGMIDGDGRNDALFKWRSTLERSHVMNKEEIEKTIRVINEYLFDTPIVNSELFKTVLRDKSDVTDANKPEKENIYNIYAEELIGRYDLVSYFDHFYKFNGVYYESINEVEVEQIIHNEISKNISSAGRKEIIQFLKIKTQVAIDDFDKDWYKIAVKNGVLNLVTGEVEAPNKTEINTIYIPFTYTDDPVYSPRIDNFMKEISGGDVVKMQFLYQIAGYCLLKKNLFAKFLVCKGEGGTGKSTYTNLLQKLVGGDNNCSHISLADFDKDYYLSTTISKLVNIDDDVTTNRALEGTGKFKSFISGDKISVRQIYAPVMTFRPYATCIFSCNKLPKIMDNTSGLLRRMILIELNNKVEKPDPRFMEKVSDTDMEYLLYKAVEGIKLAIEEGHFRITQSEAKLLALFKRRQSPLNEWLYETDITYADLHMTKCITLYNQFVAWSTENGYSKPMTAFSFKDDISALYDIEIRRMPLQDGKAPVEVFYKPGDFDPTYRPNKEIE